MAPPDLAKVLAKIKHVPEDQQARALANLSREELQALHEQVAKVDIPWGNLDLEQVALMMEMPLSKLETFLHYDEQIKHMSSHETDVNRFMKQTADEIPPTAVPGITECRRQSNELRSDIFSSFEALKTMLAYHKDLTKKRWIKKSRAQKGEILLIAWPGMSARHRPDMDENVYLQDNTTAIANPEEVFAPAAWPYINLEDLLEPNALLMFMNARGRNSPHKFAHADLELAPVVKLRKAFLALRQDDCTMMILGESSTGNIWRRRRVGQRFCHPRVH